MAEINIYTRYYWVEITDDGRTKVADWATQEGYVHQDLAIVHFYNYFSLVTNPDKYPAGPRYKLEKRYAVR